MKKNLKTLKFSKKEISDLTKEEQQKIVGGNGTLAGNTCELQQTICVCYTAECTRLCSQYLCHSDACSDYCDPEDTYTSNGYMYCEV